MLWYLFSAALLAYAISAQAEPTVQVKAKVEIDSQTEILLRDIVELQDVPEAVAAELNKVKLADAPKRGESRYFTDLGITQILRQHLRGAEERMGHRLILVVPARITVTRKSMRLKENEVRAEIVRQLHQVCEECEFDIVQLSLPAIDPSMPEGSTWHVKVRPELPKGNFSFPVEIRHDDSTKRILWVSGNLVIRKKVPVAKRLLSLGEILAETDYAVERRDISYETDSPATVAELNAATITRAIFAGQMIPRSAVRRQAMIRSGEPVQVIAGAAG